MTSQNWPRTAFDTKEWLQAWSRATIETVVGSDSAEPGMFAVSRSPFWGGYEYDAGLEPIWDRPVLTIGSLYSFYGPSYLLAEDAGDAVAATMRRAQQRAAEWDTAGILVANLPQQAALAWARRCQPDASVRLDLAYHRILGAGADPVVGDVSRKVRKEWQRRWRRASEFGLKLVEETAPDPARVQEVVELANASAVRHGWPPVYDLATCLEVLDIPGSRLLRVDHEGRTAAGIVALEYERTLYLWAGGVHPTLFREVSPYLFLFYEVLATGADRGWDRIEFGRGNDAFKRRYGAQSTETWSLWYARSPEQAATYRPRLAALHEGLSAAIGVPPTPLGGPA
jgi:CelD/BcsL family acetyltransferase involved in cellulose biosynthesis